MADNYTSEVDRSDSTARTLAVIGIIIAVMAFAWAYKADNTAKDAGYRADSSMQVREIKKSTDDDSADDLPVVNSVPAETSDTGVAPMPATKPQP